MHHHQHDDLPNARRVHHRLASGNAFDDVLRHLLHRCHFLALGFEVAGHGRVGRAWLDEHHFHIRIGQAMLHALRVARHQAFGCTVHIVGLAATVTRNRADDGDGAVVGRHHGLGKGFGKQHGRDAVDLQSGITRQHIVLACSLIRQRAMRDQHHVHGRKRCDGLNGVLNGRSIHKVCRHHLHMGLRAAHTQIVGHAVGARFVAPDKGEARGGGLHPHACAVFGHGRGGANDDDVLHS